MSDSDIGNSQHPTANRNAFRVGDKVKVAERFGGAAQWGVKRGVVYTVTKCYTTASGFMVDIVLQDGDKPNTGFGSDWFVHAEPVGPDYIPFTLTKETSKAYAKRSNSTKLDPDQRRVLDKAAKGQEVDAVAFRKAVTAALSLAATRAGQSMARREYTKMARHLLYIVDAVLDNALQGLPPVDAGTRSPKIAEQAREIDDLRATVQRMAAEVEDYKRGFDADRERIAALIVEKSDAEEAWVRLAESTRSSADVLNYALSLMDDESKFKVVGYRDRVNEGK